MDVMQRHCMCRTSPVCEMVPHNREVTKIDVLPIPPKGVHVGKNFWMIGVFGISRSPMERVINDNSPIGRDRVTVLPSDAIRHEDVMLKVVLFDFGLRLTQIDQGEL